jgi:hypothetical protein
VKRYLWLLAIIPSLSFGQAAWDSNRLSWDAPTTCTNGQPITACPITGYKVERSATQTGTFTTLATVTGTTYTHTGAASGTNCYRVSAVSATGTSAPSNVACRTNTPPVPNPPTNLTVTDVVAFEVKANESTFAFDRGRAVGTAKLGAACDEDRTMGGGYYALERPSRVKLTREPRSHALVAKCG